MRPFRVVSTPLIPHPFVEIPGLYLGRYFGSPSHQPEHKGTAPIPPDSRKGDKTGLGDPPDSTPFCRNPYHIKAVAVAGGILVQYCSPCFPFRFCKYVTICGGLVMAAPSITSLVISSLGCAVGGCCHLCCSFFRRFAAPRDSWWVLPPLLLLLLAVCCLSFLCPSMPSCYQVYPFMCLCGCL